MVNAGGHRVSSRLQCTGEKIPSTEKASDIMRVVLIGTAKMKIALIGYGKMGREVEQVALQKGHQITARIDPIAAGRTAFEISAESVKSADICVEFSQPQAVMDNVEKAARFKKPMVVGTTGWYEQLSRIEAAVQREQTGLVYAPNFSLGVNLFYRIAETAAQLFGRFEDYDVSGLEIHHRKKVDTPSGTARKLGEIVLSKFPRKRCVVTEPLDRAIAPDEFHLVSVRSGSFPGTHTLVFDADADTIELTHTARSRAGFASGALLAAEWVLGRKGVYTFDQVLEDLFHSMT
jgi:4-hydroxy-tetrahydrodipicolinate reductase